MRRALLPAFFLARFLSGDAPAKAEEAGWAAVRVEARLYRFTLYEVRFPSAVRGRFPPNDTVWGHLYLPNGPRGGAKPPCILVLPVLAAPNTWIEERFVHALLGDGYAVFMLEMPYQFHRRPGPLLPSGQVFLSRTPKGLAANFRQALSDAGRAVGWLGRSGMVDENRLGVFGASLGAMVGAKLLSIDGRLKGGVFLLGGADFPDLVTRSEMTRKFIRGSGIRPEDLRPAWRGLDPLEDKERNRGKRALLINARGDAVIPRENALKLKEAFPDARQIWLPLGHYTAILHLAWIPAYVSWAFRSILR